MGTAVSLGAGRIFQWEPRCAFHEGHEEHEDTKQYIVRIGYADLAQWRILRAAQKQHEVVSGVTAGCGLGWV